MYPFQLFLQRVVIPSPREKARENTVKEETEIVNEERVPHLGLELSGTASYKCWPEATSGAFSLDLPFLYAPRGLTRSVSSALPRLSQGTECDEYVTMFSQTPNRMLTRYD